MANYKRMFLDGYGYFITVVTHNREPILIENINILRNSFRESKRYYKYDIEAICVDDYAVIIGIDRKDTKKAKFITAYVADGINGKGEKAIDLIRSSEKW